MRKKRSAGLRTPRGASPLRMLLMPLLTMLMLRALAMTTSTSPRTRRKLQSPDYSRVALFCMLKVAAVKALAHKSHYMPVVPIVAQNRLPL